MKTLHTIKTFGDPPKYFVDFANSLLNKPMNIVDEFIREEVCIFETCHGNTNIDGAWLTNKDGSDRWSIDLIF